MIKLRESGRILYISSVDLSVGNGPGVNEREFALALYNAIGERVHFLIPQPEYPFDELPGAVCTYSLPHKRHHPLYLISHMVSQARLADHLISTHKFDFLVFRLDLFPIAPRHITRKHHIPYAIKTLGQGTLTTLDERGGWLGKPFEAINRNLIRSLLNDAVVTDVVNPRLAEFIQQTLNTDNHNVICIDNAVNTRRFYPSSREAARKALGLTGFDPIICYVGTRPWERGGMQIIEVTPRLSAKYANIGLVILGDGLGLVGLKERAAELGVENHCVFVGQVPFEKVPMYINASDVGVSINLRPDRERASELKVRQYLACGKPVVASPSFNEFLVDEHLGSVVEPHDIYTIARELDRWLSLSLDEKVEFSDLAFCYARERLSVEGALAMRFAAWQGRLKPAQTSTQGNA